MNMDDVPVPTSTVNVKAAPFAQDFEKSLDPGKGQYLTAGYLPAPLSGPIRPLSPDALSTFSADEYEQIRPARTLLPEASAAAASSQEPSYATSRGWRARLQSSWIRNTGLAYMLAAQIFGCLMNVLTRLLEIEGNKGKGLHPFQILFARMGITMVLASTYMYFRKTPYFPLGMKEVRWLLAARGFFGFFGVVGMYWSLLYLPLADATVITFLAPALACFACSILLKEPFTRLERIGALVSLVGVVLIARPTSLFGSGNRASNNVPASGNSDGVADANTPASAPGSDASNYENVTPEERLFAVGIALVGVVGAAIVITIIRWIGKRAHPLISVNYFATWCVFTSLLAQLTVPGVGFLLPADLKDWSLLFALGTCGFVMQYCLAAGLSYEKSSRATNITYTQMLFALGFDKLIFGHTPDVISILGSSLILGAAIVVAMQQSSVQVAPPPRAHDAESQRGLMAGMRESRAEEGGGQLQMQMQEQDLQLRNI